MTRERSNPPRRLPNAVRCRGTATIEFALVFPVILVLVLLLTQITLLMGSYSYLHYAAFAAARAAIVQVPTSNEVENVNVTSNADNSPKRAAIRRAAVYALVPIAGRTAGDPSTVANNYLAGLHNYFGEYNQESPAWINNLAADRLRYADAHTEVVISNVELDDTGRVITTELPSTSQYTFGPKDPIMVRVNHRLNLSVPYVSAFFANGALTAAEGGGRYREVTAYYVLTNEGVYDALPPRPEIPRDDAP